MENNVTRCLGNWFVENKNQTWFYRYFILQDIGCRLFEVTKDNKVIITDAYTFETITTISVEKFKKEFGNMIFFNVLYYYYEAINN